MKQAFIIILSIFLLLPISGFAQESASPQAERSSTQSEDAIAEVVLKPGEEVTGPYFISGDDVTVSGTIDGDAYVAGGNVFVDGAVNGDLFILSGNVTMNGTVSQDLRVVGGSVMIDGSVGRDVSVMTGNLVISEGADISGNLVGAVGNAYVTSPIGGQIAMAAGQLTIANAVGGTVRAAAGQIKLTQNAAINGDLRYWSENNASIQESATISGQIQQNQPPKEFDGRRQVSDEFSEKLIGLAIVFEIISLIAALIVGFLILAIFPGYSSMVSDTVTSRIWTSLGIGFAAVFLIPLAVVILFITILGLPLAMIVLFSYLVLVYIAQIFVALALGRVILGATNGNANNYLAFSVGMLALFILGLIPFVDLLTGLITLIVGFGGILLNEYKRYPLLRKHDLY
ncbi:MAG: hypothetical protein ACOCXQ_04125 [Patescibacteria group bacterium]